MLKYGLLHSISSKIKNIKVYKCRQIPIVCYKKNNKHKPTGMNLIHWLESENFNLYNEKTAKRNLCSLNNKGVKELYSEDFDLL